MLDITKSLIYIDGKERTRELDRCDWIQMLGVYQVQFSNSSNVYSYKKYRVKEYNAIGKIPIDSNIIFYKGRKQTDIELLVKYENGNYFLKPVGKEGWVCEGKDISVDKMCLSNPDAKSVFDYLKQLATLGTLRNDKGELLLPKKYEAISDLSERSVLSCYLNPAGIKFNEYIPRDIYIFPFGCNSSQYKAVINAFTNRVSVIQGPPGTGKTQTILNIIANAIIRGKSVQVVSNNNSAIENVIEKLAFPQYGMDFIVALLGSSDNKRNFIENQSGHYPDFGRWKELSNKQVILANVQQVTEQIQEYFQKQEQAALLRAELSDLQTEKVHFETFLDESSVSIFEFEKGKELTAKELMRLWQRAQTAADEGKALGKLYLFLLWIKYGVKWNVMYQKPLIDIIVSVQLKYYARREKELEGQIQELNEYLSQKNNAGMIDKLKNYSMDILQDAIIKKYKGKPSRKLFSERDLRYNPGEFQQEYPVVLSTTFSSVTSLGKDAIFDYVIMDEASQVDVATGALAMSTGRNAIIVGDCKQLPNVVPPAEKEKSELIFAQYKVNAAYKYVNSFLKSIIEIMPKVPQVTLREHYRCHPKIIDFCNKKFYNNELLIMTRDNGEEDVLKAIRTVEGNHARGRENQREVDSIQKEILPGLDIDHKEIGIISPYRDQVRLLKRTFADIECDTVHKFQGREKDTIIISTVDNKITEFSDDPNLMNVAISRAKKRLMLVTTGNEQEDGNVRDLVEYIRYQNYDVEESKIYSVFDYLYKQYTESRQAYLKDKKQVSKYESENLMFNLILEAICEVGREDLFVLCHYPLNKLIKDPCYLNDEECKYAMNPATHLDFLIYSKISKRPIVAIEVDGFHYHKEGTEQAERDKKKNHILELYGIPLMRFATNGSGEKEKIMEFLRKM
ncbi:MAG: DUF2726 domain-containing protein [Lachnospiraceae bacterium]|nr:DUF2726 domain-containing protein [Lachnospiraceae bacterium]MBR3761345.1 DUF2726 domain-containing protein [Lachnospiraceae bacterium]